MEYGSDGSDPYMQWNFYEEGGYYRIENEGLRRKGCRNSWLRSNVGCEDNDLRREGEIFNERWRVSRTDNGTYNLISYWKMLHC